VPIFEAGNGGSPPPQLGHGPGVLCKNLPLQGFGSRITLEDICGQLNAIIGKNLSWVEWPVILSQRLSGVFLDLSGDVIGLQMLKPAQAHLVPPAPDLAFRDRLCVTLPAQVQAWRALMVPPWPQLALRFRICDAISARFGALRDLVSLLLRSPMAGLAAPLWAKDDG
jgi:hypothetical protein